MQSRFPFPQLIDSGATLVKCKVCTKSHLILGSETMLSGMSI